MTTAFVLSGGGSLGAVQVGMLQALAAEGVEPDLLVGTSAGALNAAWVASHGMSESSLEGLARVWSGLRRRDVFPVDVRTALGATSVWVLPTGAACALPGPPSSAIGTAVHALTLLIEQRRGAELVHRSRPRAGATSGAAPGAPAGCRRTGTAGPRR
jgi:hypothetical protein